MPHDILRTTKPTVQSRPILQNHALSRFTHASHASHSVPSPCTQLQKPKHPPPLPTSTHARLLINRTLHHFINPIPPKLSNKSNTFQLLSQCPPLSHRLQPFKPKPVFHLFLATMATHSSSAPLPSNPSHRSPPASPLSPTPSPRPTNLLRSPLLALNPVLTPPSTDYDCLRKTKSVPASPVAPRDDARRGSEFTHVGRVARATREFRDVWIVPE